VNTRRAGTRQARAALLAEALLFARLHLQPSSRPATATDTVARDADRAGRTVSTVMPGTEPLR
jgi:hypothetical protein